MDLERGTIRVFRAVKDKGTWIGPPKNGKARIVPIPLTLSKMLSEWKLRSKGPWVFGYSKNRLMGYSHWGVAVARAARAWAGQCIPHVVPVYDEGEARAVDNFLKKYRASK